ncbi:hypothetical protein GN244_ATG20570 [Phytophthora infestans]|uniref:Uncharacterized protein n=1 Tax=Phytophthora infestans TaxID=4787 RepID=A0A833SSN7_PHYIN|nr:hypothetical protein GN244_ATG20570 [Phytophthora infestans]
MLLVKLDAIASHVAAVNTEGKPCVWVLDSEKVGELATTKACVVAVNAEGKPCVWVLDSEKVANLMMWVL